MTGGGAEPFESGHGVLMRPYEVRDAENDTNKVRHNFLVVVLVFSGVCQLA
jgi:hypothetical protein